MPERRASHSWRLVAGLLAVTAGLVVLPHLLSFSQKEVAVFLLINVLLVVRPTGLLGTRDRA